LVVGLLLSVPLSAQTNPCDLNGDGVVNIADVLDALGMLRGELQCTADVVGAGVCSWQLVRRVESATQTGVCVTGDPSPPTLSTSSVSPTLIESGQSSVGTVTLSGGPAGAGGVLVALMCSNLAARVPPSILIPEGSDSATFPIVGNAVSGSIGVIVTASYSGVWSTADLTVNAAPLSLSSLAVSPGSFASGQTATGIIQLNGAAPDGGASVSLTSTNSAISFPAAVTIPQGSDSANFTVTANLVITETQVQLTASYSGGNSGVTLTIDPASVTLTWVASTSPDIAGYNVFRGTASGGPYTQLNPTLVPGTSYVDTTVLPGSTYYYVTTAVNTSNIQSAYSNEAEAAVP
jgi:hypothetical protein